MLREDDANSKNLSATIIFSNIPSSTRAIKSEGYYLQLQNLLHRASPAMSYKGTCYTNVESLDREPQNLRLGMKNVGSVLQQVGFGLGILSISSQWSYVNKKPFCKDELCFFAHL